MPIVCLTTPPYHNWLPTYYHTTFLLSSLHCYLPHSLLLPPIYPFTHQTFCYAVSTYCSSLTCGFCILLPCARFLPTVSAVICCSHCTACASGFPCVTHRAPLPPHRRLTHHRHTTVTLVDSGFTCSVRAVIACTGQVSFAHAPHAVLRLPTGCRFNRRSHSTGFLCQRCCRCVLLPFPTPHRAPPTRQFAACLPAARTAV